MALDRVKSISVVSALADTKGLKGEMAAIAIFSYSFLTFFVSSPND